MRVEDHLLAFEYANDLKRKLELAQLAAKGYSNYLNCKDDTEKTKRLEKTYGTFKEVEAGLSEAYKQLGITEKNITQHTLDILKEEKAKDEMKAINQARLLLPKMQNLLSREREHEHEAGLEF